jgi:hypothetical protein
LAIGDRSTRSVLVWQEPVFSNARLRRRANPFGCDLKGTRALFLGVVAYGYSVRLQYQSHFRGSHALQQDSELTAV